MWAQQCADPAKLKRSTWDIIDEMKIRYLCPRIPKAGLALEVGCGSARLSLLLASLGWRVVGIDMAPSALQLARIRFDAARSEIDLIACDAYLLPFRDATFDLVLSTGLLEHFEDARPVVSEMARVLRAGGLLYSDIVPRKFSLFRSLDGAGRLFKGGRSSRMAQIFERSLPRSEIENIFRESATLDDLSVVSQGIHLPRTLFSTRVPLLRLMEYNVAKVFNLLTSRLDGSPIADLLGFYYIVSGSKR
ncbi:MAG: class I SAM-dependent methyltransferase [Chloroflexi bacterium]|nr:class I SAM-dependent methyltransferase [Chloroflexota bacterium]